MSPSLPLTVVALTLALMASCERGGDDETEETTGTEESSEAMESETEAAPEEAADTTEAEDSGEMAEDTAETGDAADMAEGEDGGDAATEGGDEAASGDGADTATDMTEDEDACGASQYQDLVGQPRSEAEAVDWPEPFRIVGPDTAVTMDFNPERINIVYDENDVVTRIDCG